MLPLHHRGCRSTSTSPSGKLGSTTTVEEDDLPALKSTAATTRATTTSPSLSSAAGLLIERVFSVSFVRSSSSASRTAADDGKQQQAKENNEATRRCSKKTKKKRGTRSGGRATSCWRRMLILLPLFIMLAYYSQQRTHILRRHHRAVATDNKDDAVIDDDHDVLDVLIVGGGWAGLAAAHTLQTQQDGNNASKIKFEIFEARNYVGGRSHTIYHYLDRRLAVEIGSGWLYKNTEVYDIFVNNNIPFGKIHHEHDMKTWGLYYNNNHAGRGGGPLFQVNHDKDYNNTTHPSSKSTSSSGSHEITTNERAELLDQLWWEEFVPFSKNRTKQLRAGDNDLSYANILEEFLRQKKKASSSQLSQQQEFDRIQQFLYAMVHAQIEIEYAASTNDVSARQVGKSVNDCLFCGANYLVQVDGGGFDKAISTLANPLLQQNSIHLNHVVTQIEYSNGKGNVGNNQLARVTYQIQHNNKMDGDGHPTRATKGPPPPAAKQQFTKWAKIVLVTVPLGVLKHGSIKFVPPLPQSKQNAIDFVGFGVLNKCVLYWEKRKAEGRGNNNKNATWWPHGREILTLITDQVETSGNWTSFFNEKEIGNGGHYVLSAWTGGDNAVAMESQSDSTIVAQVMNNLRSMLGGEVIVPDPSSYAISRWGQDEFARGSYSFSSVGRQSLMDSAREQLGAQVGEQLFWAGEATHYKWSGTTVGAYRSGVTAAEDILLALSHGLPPPPPDEKKKVTTTVL